MAVDALRAGVETWTMLTRLVYFRLGLGSLVVCNIGAGTGVLGEEGFGGDTARLLAVDSRLCRAGRTRLGGVVPAIICSLLGLTRRLTCSEDATIVGELRAS